MRYLSALAGVGLAIVGNIGIESCATTPTEPPVYEVTIIDVNAKTEESLLEQVIAENQRAWPWHEYIFPRAIMDDEMITWAQNHGHEPIRDKRYANGISGFDPPLTEKEQDEIHHLPSRTDMRQYVQPSLKIGERVNIPGITDTTQYNNKALLISFGGSWCPPCLEELDFLKEWYVHERPRHTELTEGFEVVAIALDADLAKAQERYGGLPFPVVYATETPIKWNDYIKGNLPTNFILDKQRRLVWAAELIIDSVGNQERIPQGIFSYGGMYGYECWNHSVYRSITTAALAK